MAKLNVKVIEATGGEITKVAYDGAEYALVSGNGKIGDLALCTREQTYFTNGEFYEVTELSDSGEWVHAIDDEGDRYHMDVKVTAKLFRKIEEASELTTKFSAGDVVVTLEKCGWAKGGQGVMLEGAIGKVKSVNGDKLTVKFNKKQPTPNATKQARKNFVVYTSEVRLATAEEAATIAKKKKAEYVPQEGDIVVVTANNTGSQNSVGDIGKVGAEKPLADGGVCVYVPGGPTSCIRTWPSDIRKATPAEVDAYEKAVATASKPKLKAGDFVKFEEPDLLDITVGKIYEVQTDDEGDLCIIDDEGDEDYSYLAEFAIKVDADEAKWAKIGRKVDEYKVGDIIEITRDQCGDEEGTIAKVVKIREDISGVDYASLSSCRGAYAAGNDSIKLIAPVESTLN